MGWPRSGGAGAPLSHLLLRTGGTGNTDRRERRRLLQRDLAGTAQLEQREERDRLLDPRQSDDLLLEVEAVSATEQRAELLQEPGNRREAKLEVSERDLRRLGRQSMQQYDERLRILFAEAPLPLRSQRRRPEPEEPVALRGQPFAEPLGGALDPPVLLQAPRQLLGRFGRL